MILFFVCVTMFIINDVRCSCEHLRVLREARAEIAAVKSVLESQTRRGPTKAAQCITDRDVGDRDGDAFVFESDIGEFVDPDVTTEGVFDARVEKYKFDAEV